MMKKRLCLAFFSRDKNRMITLVTCFMIRNEVFREYFEPNLYKQLRTKDTILITVDLSSKVANSRHKYNSSSFRRVLKSIKNIRFHL